MTVRRFAVAFVLAFGMAVLPASASQGPSKCWKYYCLDTPFGAWCVRVPWPCPEPEPCPEWLPWCEWLP